MFDYIEKLTLTEAGQLKDVLRRLFSQTCILQVKYDPVTLTPKENPRYRVCEQHREFIRDYLEVQDCELRHDPQEHIFWLEGEGAARERLGETTTLLILLLKLIYRDKILGEGLNATVTNLAEIREYGKNTGLIARRLTGQEWREALTLMKTHQMIELPGAVAHVEDDTPIYLYGTIHIYCPSADIRALIERYREDVERMAGPEGKEEAGETAQEDFYQDAAE